MAGRQNSKWALAKWADLGEGAAYCEGIWGQKNLEPGEGALEVAADGAKLCW